MGLHTNSATHTQYTHTQTHETADVFFINELNMIFFKKKNEDTQILHTSANFKSYFSLNSCKILVKNVMLSNTLTPSTHTEIIHAWQTKRHLKN